MNARHSDKGSTPATPYYLLGLDAGVIQMALVQVIDVRPKIVYTALFMFVLCGLFHFSQYAARSAPGVMLPELSLNFGITTASLGALIGSYYYTYSLTLWQTVLANRPLYLDQESDNPRRSASIFLGLMPYP